MRLSQVLRHVARRQIGPVVFQRKQTQDRVIHVVVPSHELDVVPGAGFQARRNRPFDVRNVVVEGQRAGRFEVLVDALPRPAFDGFAQRASRRPTEPGAEDAIANRLIPKPHVHAPGPVRPQRANGFEIGRFLVGKRRIGFERIECVVQLHEDRIVRHLVRERLFDARLEGRDIASLLAPLHQFQSNELPFQIRHFSDP